MKRCIQEKQCRNCNHCIESKYHYYTHDNRMVECHLYTCGKQDNASSLDQEEHCLSWEDKRRF